MAAVAIERTSDTNADQACGGRGNDKAAGDESEAGPELSSTRTDHGCGAADGKHDPGNGARPFASNANRHKVAAALPIMNPNTLAKHSRGLLVARHEEGRPAAAMQLVGRLGGV